MSEGTRFLHFIARLAIIAMSLYFGFHVYFDLFVYTNLCIGIAVLFGAIVYDTDMFREFDEDLRKRIVGSWFVAFCLDELLATLFKEFQEQHSVQSWVGFLSN